MPGRTGDVRPSRSPPKCAFGFFLSFSVGTGLKEQLTQAGPTPGFEVCPYFFVTPPSLVSVAYFHSHAFECSSPKPPLASLQNKHLPFFFFYYHPKTLSFPFSSP